MTTATELVRLTSGSFVTLAGPLLSAVDTTIMTGAGAAPATGAGFFLGDDALLMNARPSTPETRHLGAYEVVFGIPPEISFHVFP